jgi:hypothetical protein
MLLSRCVSTVVRPCTRVQIERDRQAGMSRMRLAAQAVGHKDVDTVEQAQHFLGNFTEIRRISD